MTTSIQKLTIGRKDKADFPEFNLKNLTIKIDTGAYSCSIDCESASLVNEKDSEILRVVFLNRNHPCYTGTPVDFSDFIQKKVTSSTGEAQFRYFVPGKIVLFGQEYSAYFSLTDRSGMRSPVLIGRKLLNANFIVDTSQINLSNKLKKKVK